MNLQSNESEKRERVSLDAFLKRALLLDLEVSYQGTRSGRGSFEETVKDLDRLAEGASCGLS